MSDQLLVRKLNKMIQCIYNIITDMLNNLLQYYRSLTSSCNRLFCREMLYNNHYFPLSLMNSAYNGTHIYFSSNIRNYTNKLVLKITHKIDIPVNTMQFTYPDFLGTTKLVFLLQQCASCYAHHFFLACMHKYVYIRSRIRKITVIVRKS